MAMACRSSNLSPFSCFRKRRFPYECACRDILNVTNNNARTSRFKKQPHLILLCRHKSIRIVHFSQKIWSVLRAKGLATRLWLHHSSTASERPRLDSTRTANFTTNENSQKNLWVQPELYYVSKALLRETKSLCTFKKNSTQASRATQVYYRSIKGDLTWS